MKMPNMVKYHKNKNSNLRANGICILVPNLFILIAQIMVLIQSNDAITETQNFQCSY
jgi:hypothetical protein